MVLTWLWPITKLSYEKPNADICYLNANQPNPRNHQLRLYHKFKSHVKELSGVLGGDAGGLVGVPHLPLYPGLREGDKNPGGPSNMRLRLQNPDPPKNSYLFLFWTILWIFLVNYTMTPKI